MASLDQSITIGLELSEIAPSAANRRDANEHTSARSVAVEPAEQMAGCPLLRGIVFAAIPALLMWAAILGLAAKLL
jgi:hypothetical protein